MRESDAVRLLDRAVELGLREPRVVLRLAHAHNLVSRNDDALRTLDLVPAATGDPALDAERAHVLAAARLFDEPEQAAAELVPVAEQWRALGNQVQEGWAHANRGVALFNLSRMREASDALERGLELFAAAGEKGGKLAAVSFLALVRPNDPNLPEWLETALRHAEEAGDRGRQVSALLSLTWHHYFWDRLGDAGERAQVEHYAGRLAEVAAEVSSNDLHVQALCLRASMARLGGRVDEAVALAEQAAARAAHHEREVALVRSAMFTAELARGCDPSVPALEPSTDPAVSVAAQLETEALVLAGRPEEGLARLAGPGGRPDLGPAGRVVGLTEPLALVLAGRPAEALPLLVELSHFSLTPSTAVARAIRALRAEITGDLDELPAAVSWASADGIAAALAVRARARHGDRDAWLALRAAAEELAAPGLLAGMPG